MFSPDIHVLYSSHIIPIPTQVLVDVWLSACLRAEDVILRCPGFGAVCGMYPTFCTAVLRLFDLQFLAQNLILSVRKIQLDRPESEREKDVNPPPPDLGGMIEQE